MPAQVVDSGEVMRIPQDEESFFEVHRDGLYDLFVALDRENEWRETAQDLLPYTQHGWVGREHGNNGNKDQFTPDQVATAKGILKEMGFYHEVLPHSGHYEQIIGLGGMMRVNRQRIQFTKDILDKGMVTADRIVFWTGQRLRDDRDDEHIELVDIEALASNPWIQHETTKDLQDPWGRKFSTETQLARLAFLETFGHEAPLKRIATEMTPGPTGIPNVPRRGATRYHYKADGYPEFVLMNSAAVERAPGDPRPTIVSQAHEWFAKFSPTPSARILLVAGNPHILRNIREVRRLAKSHGRTDIDFVVCGPATNKIASIQLVLGEVGRLLYMDAQTQNGPMQ